MAVFDPLDGSSNVDASIPVGTIFGMCVSHASVETGAGWCMHGWMDRMDGWMPAAFVFFFFFQNSIQSSSSRYLLTYLRRPPTPSFESQEETECLLDDDDLAGNVDPEEVS